jgi:hypothetical protein
MAELVDALGSGPSGGNTVEVRVLFWAPGYILQDPRSRAYSLSISVLCLSVNYYGTKSTPFAAAPSFFRQEIRCGVYQETGQRVVRRNRQRRRSEARYF